jgi:hypothetical protein
MVRIHSDYRPHISSRKLLFPATRYKDLVQLHLIGFSCLFVQVNQLPSLIISIIVVINKAIEHFHPHIMIISWAILGPYLIMLKSHQSQIELWSFSSSETSPAENPFFRFHWPINIYHFPHKIILFISYLNARKIFPLFYLLNI